VGHWHVPLRRPPHATLDALLRRELVREEDPGTAALIRDLAAVRQRGYFRRGEFVRMCRWKSPRARHAFEANTPGRIRAVSRRVLASQDERERMTLLTSLRGVGVPIGSAILTLLDPRRYGVLDIRAWQLLFAMGSASTNARGQSFTITQWEHYLAALRHYARRLNTTARAIEYTLFLAHRSLHQGRLYRRSERRRRRRSLLSVVGEAGRSTPQGVRRPSAGESEGA
jgi:hypothetical protein